MSMKLAIVECLGLRNKRVFWKQLNVTHDLFYTHTGN